MGSGKAEKIWYSFFGGPLPENEIYFFDKNEFQWTREIENNSGRIKKEVLEFLNSNSELLVPYFNNSMVSAPKKWKTLSFKFWDLRFKNNCSKVPFTIGLLEKIPGLVSASISILEPNTSIHPHRGDTTAIVRCHFPLTVPGKLPHSGLQVGEESRDWEEGKLLLFNDSAKHQAWNQTGNQRVILILDIILPKYLDKKREICRNVLASLLFQMLSQKLRFLKNFNRPLKITLHSILKLNLRLALPIIRITGHSN